MEKPSALKSYKKQLPRMGYTIQSKQSNYEKKNFTPNFAGGWVLFEQSDTGSSTGCRLAHA